MLPDVEEARLNSIEVSLAFVRPGDKRANSSPAGIPRIGDELLAGF